MDDYHLAKLIADYLIQNTLDIDEVRKCRSRDGTEYLDITTTEKRQFTVTIVECF